MKKVLVLLLSLVLMFALVACGGGDKKSTAKGEGSTDIESFTPVKLRVGHSHSETEIPHLEMLQMAQNIFDRTGGKVIVEIYPSNQLGTNEDLVEQMRFGTNLALYADPGRLDSFAKGVSAISAPFVISGYEDIERLNDLPVVKGWMNTLENNYGLTVLSWNWCQGYRNVFANKGGRTPKDFAGVQLRAATAPIWVATVETLGATAVALEFGEMYSGIQTKIVDGCEQNYGAIYNNSIYEVISTMTETRHVYLANCVIISSKWLRNLPQEFQDIILEECNAGGQRTSEKLAELDDFYFKEMQKYGMKVISHDELDMKAFMANAELAYKKLGLTEAVNALKADLGK